MAYKDVFVIAPVCPFKDVTPPPAGVDETQVVPLEVRMFPFAPGATVASALVPLPSSTLFAVNVAAPVPPLATGSVPVTFVAAFTNVVDVEPVPPLATGRVPVTPVVKGRPVQLVKVPDEGVPSTGVTRVGLVIVCPEAISPPATCVKAIIGSPLRVLVCCLR